MQIINNQIIQNNAISNYDSTTQVNNENKTVSFESYLNAINEVQSVKNSAYSQSTPKIDYSNYTPAQIKEIPYEEAKANYDAINQRINDLGMIVFSFDEGMLYSDACTQLCSVKLSD